MVSSTRDVLKTVKRDALDFLHGFLDYLVGQEVDSTQLVVLAPDLPGAPREVLERRELVVRGQLSLGRHGRCSWVSAGMQALRSMSGAPRGLSRLQG